MGMEDEWGQSESEIALGEDRTRGGIGELEEVRWH